LEQHKHWFYELKEKYGNNNIDYDKVLKMEVGKVFERVLMDAGVFKLDSKGLAAFSRFIEFIR
jgi:UDPglucose--hexose-1-phosphate uridylyltransferase